jgi:ABC-type multidrug transport system fused ATPase/permease subunit
MDNSKATIIEVMEAARAAGVHDDIIRRGGYGQSVGPSGLQLSKGEVARIIIARALLNSNEAEVVIFDEPTINLDNKSIKVIKETFERLSLDKIVIIVTHDINFVENAEIIVMEKGRIAERGSIKEIIELGGIGAELNELQNKKQQE